MNFFEAWESAVTCIKTHIADLQIPDYSFTEKDVNYFSLETTTNFIEIRVDLNSYDSDQGFDSLPYSETALLECGVIVSGANNDFEAKKAAYTIAAKLRTLFTGNNSPFTVYLDSKSIEIENILGSDKVTAVFYCYVKHHVL